MTKSSIDAYKDRMSSPVGIVRTDPKTRKPSSKNLTVKKGGKKK